MTTTAQLLQHKHSYGLRAVAAWLTCNRKPTAIVTKLTHAGVNFLHNILELDKRTHRGFAMLINGTGKQGSRKQHFCVKLNYVLSQLMFQHSE
jgi:hypothetical protein